MSLLDKLLGRTPAEAEAPPDDSWMSEEQRAAKLAWWESKWMDRIVGALALLMRSVAIAGALGLLALLGWMLYRTPVPPLPEPISTDMVRAASFGMIPLVLGVPIGLALFYFVGRFLFNVIVAIFKSPLHKVYKPLATPFVSILLLAALAFFHQPLYGALDRLRARSRAPVPVAPAGPSSRWSWPAGGSARP